MNTLSKIVIASVTGLIAGTFFYKWLKPKTMSEKDTLALVLANALQEQLNGVPRLEVGETPYIVHSLIMNTEDKFILLVNDLVITDHQETVVDETMVSKDTGISKYAVTISFPANRNLEAQIDEFVGYMADITAIINGVIQTKQAEQA